MHDSGIRWRIWAFMFGFGFIAYVQKSSITVVAERMIPELGLSQMQIGLLQEAFILAYTLCQIPGGVFGQKLGARRAMIIAGLVAFFATVATPLAPAVSSGFWLFAALVALQALLGVGQSCIFPVSSGVFEAWFPSYRWPLVQGLQTMGLGWGSAVTPPLIAYLMVNLGWQQALLLSSLPALALIAGWALYARNTPREHARVNAAELAHIGPRPQAVADTNVTMAQVVGMMRNRSVALIGTSYLFMNVAFYLLSNWVFLYLVQDRHFDVLEGGLLAAAPPFASSLGAGVGGAVTGYLCQRLGIRWGHRCIPLLALPLCAILLVVSVETTSPYWAVAALSLCFFCVELNEGSYWSGGMALGGSDAMAVCGVMNTGGNMGGLICIPMVSYLSGIHLWHMAFYVGAGFALLAAVAWFYIKVDEPVDSATGHSLGAAIADAV